MAVISLSTLALFPADVRSADSSNPDAGAPLRVTAGLQLYSLRAQFAKDVPGTLDKVRDFGFKTVELAGTYGLSPEKFKAELDARQLRAVSGHFPYDRFRTDVEGIAREAKIFGLEYVGCAWIDHQGEFGQQQCRDAAKVFNQAGAALAKHGLKFIYHVHGYEFRPHGKGTVFDVMLAETDPKFVNFQMDVFWVVHAGLDPVKLLEAHPTRWPLTHLKGMREGTPTGLFTGQSDVNNDVPVGTGMIDYRRFLQAASRAGVKYHIIEDESPRVEKQLPVSLRYLAELK
jgi:sugar phosphate isomerase/epimerase